MADVNSFDPVPWFIADKAVHSADVVRGLAFQATGGGEGVVLPTDCKVSATSTPSNQVKVGTGGVTILNRSPGVTGQSYTGRAIADSYLDIPATGAGGGQSHLIVVRVEDPQYSPWVPYATLDEKKVGPYIFPRRIPCPAGTTRASQLGLPHSMVALARVDMPASTSNVQAGYITDLRTLVQPRTVRELRSEILSAWLNANDLTTFKQWPGKTAQIPIPPWATHMNIQISYSGILRSSGSIGAGMRIKMGSPVFYTGPELILEYDAGTGAAAEAREAFLIADGVPTGVAIPSDVRGTTQPLYTEARRLFTEFYPGYLRAEKGGQLVWDVQFYERPS